MRARIAGRINSMKSSKVCHQLFLPEDLSKRIARIAEGTVRAHSEVLVDALEVFLNRCDAPRHDEAFSIRLIRFERHIEAVRRTLGLQWEVPARVLRHQLLTTAGFPSATADRQAFAAKHFEVVIDEIVERLAGGEPPETNDPGIAKLRTLQ
jgi:hypothetical protein